MTFFRTMLYSGTGAAVLSLGTVAVLSRLEGRDASRPINATSHVLWGPGDALHDGIDARHTLPGLLINIGSAFFWGGVYALATSRQPSRTEGGLVGWAFVTSLVAAVVDYGLVPGRLRPGWELALKARSVAIALAAMGTGLAAGGLAARDAGPPPEAAE